MVFTHWVEDFTHWIKGVKSHRYDLSYHDVMSHHLPYHITCVITSDIDRTLDLKGFDSYFEIYFIGFHVINRLCYKLKYNYLIKKYGL